MHRTKDLPSTARTAAELVTAFFTLAKDIISAINAIKLEKKQQTAYTANFEFRDMKQ